MLPIPGHDIGRVGEIFLDFQHEINLIYRSLATKVKIRLKINRNIFNSLSMCHFIIGTKQQHNRVIEFVFTIKNLI